MSAPAAPAPRQRSPGWHLATVAGVPVFLARSWLVIAAAITVLFGPQVARVDPGAGPLGAYGVALLFAVLLLLSVLVHELAHALTATGLAMSPTRIVLTLWGGHTTFDRDAPSPWASFAVSAAGPISNLALAAALYWGLGSVTLPPVGQLLLLAVVVSNAFVGLTNALPGLPLDGGRMLEALVWGLSGDRDRATVAAAHVGRVVAVAVPVLVAVALLRDGDLRGDLLALAWSALVGALLWTSASAELAWARSRRRARDADVGSLLTAALVVPADTPLSRLVQPAASGTPVVLLDGAGLPVGVLDARAASSVPPQRLDVVPASSAARGIARGALVDVATSGRELFDLLPSLPAEPWVVVRRLPDGARGADGAGGAGGATAVGGFDALASLQVLGLLRSDDVVAAVGGRRARR